MKKRFLSIIICLSLFVSLFASLSFIRAIADTKSTGSISIETVLNSTNTYNLSGNITKISNSVELGDMGYSEAQYSFAYNLNQKNNNQTTNGAYITVFTHGYNSTAKDWCNNIENLSNDDHTSDVEFTYMNNSMVDKVWSQVHLENSVVVKAEVKDEQDDPPYFSLSVSLVKGDVENLNIDNIVSKIGSKNLIIVFDGDKTNGSNNNLYYQFNFMLSNILYRLKDNYNGKIPKVNLIGHSRGGLTNLQYALDHPDIVENLISIGTPYAGSTSANVVKDFQDFKGDGLNDIINPTVYNGYKDRWNNNYNSLYKNINAVSIGAFE